MVSGPDNDLLQPASLAAQAAVISINTSLPQLENGKSRSSAQLKSGSFNTLSAQAQSAFKAGQNNTVSLQAEWLKTKGNYPYIQDNGASSMEMRRDNSDVQRLRIEGALHSNLSDNSRLTPTSFTMRMPPVSASGTATGLCNPHSQPPSASGWPCVSMPNTA